MVLVGARGSGKSAVGRQVAAALGWEFVDTDERIEQAAGGTIADIFRAQGEAAFRALEARAVAEVSGRRRQVIAVGGGAVLSDDNRRRLQAAGLCVWLTASAEELHRRLAADPRSAAQRPPLTNAGGLEEIRQILARRAPLYQAVAQHVIDTQGRTIEELAREIVALARPPRPFPDHP